MQKYLTLTVILILFLLGTLTYQFSKESSTVFPQQTPKEIKMEELAEWRLYRSVNGDFQVLLPALPQHASENVNDPKNNETRHYEMYVAEKDDGTIFMISIITIPSLQNASDPDRFQREMMQEMIAGNSNNILDTVEKGVFKGFDALDYVFGNGEMSFTNKSFVVQDKLILLSRLQKGAMHSPEEFKFFTDSFELTP